MTEVIVTLVCVGIALLFAHAAGVVEFPLFDDCRHKGPEFKVQTGFGGTPEQIAAWHTCKKCRETYVVRRYETADEFESRQGKTPVTA